MEEEKVIGEMVKIYGFNKLEPFRSDLGYILYYRFEYIYELLDTDGLNFILENRNKIENAIISFI